MRALAAGEPDGLGRPGATREVGSATNVPAGTIPGFFTAGMPRDRRVLIIPGGICPVSPGGNSARRVGNAASCMSGWAHDGSARCPMPSLFEDGAPECPPGLRHLSCPPGRGGEEQAPCRAVRARRTVVVPSREPRRGHRRPHVAVSSPKPWIITTAGPLGLRC